MTLPKTATRADIVLKVETSPGNFEPLCGVTSVDFNLSNEIVSHKAADCTDFTKAVETIKAYGAQDVKISIQAHWAAQSNSFISRWALEQKQYKIELDYVSVTTAGDVRALRGVALLTGDNLSDIGNLDGGIVTRKIDLEISGGLEVIDAT